jgi:UDP-3-O-[3-hydroxymyristoyl] glucosamine N-acyltransferase
MGANCYGGKIVELSCGVILYPNVCVFEETIIEDKTIVLSGKIIHERCIIIK